MLLFFFLPSLFDDDLLKMAAIYYNGIYLAAPFLHPFIFCLHLFFFYLLLHLTCPSPLLTPPPISKKRGVLSLGELWGKTSDAPGLPNPFFFFSLCPSLSPFLSRYLHVCLWNFWHTCTHTYREIQQQQLHSALGLTSCLRLIS